jgi:hypothetical protein
MHDTRPAAGANVGPAAGTWTFNLERANMAMQNRESAEARAIRNELRRAGATPETVSDLRGRLFLLTLAEARRSGRRRPTQRAVAAELAEEFGCDAAEVLGDAKFAKAVDLITEGCGTAARAAILSGAARLTAKQAGVISRMARKRQQYEMAEVIAGRRPFRKPKDREPPFDTHGYEEVLSRLRRAEGHARHRLGDLRAARAPPTAEERALLQEDATRIGRGARELARMLGMSCRARAVAAATTPRAAGVLSYGRIHAWLAAAATFVEKNVRDVPRLPGHVKPAADKRQELSEKLSGLIWSAVAISRHLR